MAPWIIPALKAVLPHVGTIVSAARPMFSKPAASDGDPQQNAQIAELQAAVAQNDAHIRELAAQLQGTITALEQAAAEAEAQTRRMTRLCQLAIAASVVAAGVALAALLA